MGIVLVICVASIAVSILVTISLLIVAGKYRLRSVSKDVPSVSVCIPARNEAHALADCLERVLASDYQKLEVLVLDDNSKDETSNLIKSFAHAGVRFIAGRALPDGWIGKNHALEQLAGEASGDVIVFIDVDTKIGVQTISQLISAMSPEIQMISVVPRRGDIARMSVLFGHLRYFWELILPGTPSSSALWAIRRDVLASKLDGFSRLQSHAQPEREFAEMFDSMKAYACAISTPELGVYYEKRWKSQRETSERLLWPLLTSRLSSGIIAFGCLLAWTASISLIFAASIGAHVIWGVLSTWAFGYGAYAVYLRMVWVHGWLFGALLWPIIVVQEVVFLLMSMYKHLTKTVTWKGRSITGASENQTYLTLDE